MTALTLALLLTSPAADPTPPETSKPVGVTRDEEKSLLELHKKAKPRLPMPPADPNNPLTRVNNAAFRAYYLPRELRESGFARERDPAMTLDNTFKVKLFWITSRGNNCYYCLGHQEYKLLSAGVEDDAIAVLDGDWRGATPKERIAYEFTKKLTHTPHLITTADIESMKQNYTEKQVAEILVTVAGYNSTNRWTDGLNIPAEVDGARFKKEGVKAEFDTFKTPTTEKYTKQRTTVAPLKLAARPPLEARDKVEVIWKGKRTATLPLADVKSSVEVWGDDPAPNWAAFLANFPKSMKGRVAGLKNAMEKGSLNPKLKAQIAWVAARHDRAWYALKIAHARLLKAGVSEEDIWKLDGDRKNLTESEQAALTLAETLTVAPWKVTDEMVERCRKYFKDGEVAELIYHTCNAAFFDRVTEITCLPFDK